MKKNIVLHFGIHLIFLLICSIGWGREIHPMYLQGVQQLSGTIAFASFTDYSTEESRPNYFDQCPPGAGQGTCPDYVEFFNSHIGRPVGCFSGPFNGNDPPQPACTPYSGSGEPWPEDNWPGQ